MARLNDKNNSISGLVEYTATAATHKNYYVTGVSSYDTDDTVYLHELYASATFHKDNIDIHYDGNGGYDVLDYRGNNDALTLKISTDADYSFWLRGGLRNNNDGLDSMDVFIRDVEEVNLTNRGDTVDFRDLTYDTSLVVYADSGNDVMYGSQYSDEWFGGDGNDTIGGGAGNDRLSGGKGSDVIDAGTGDDFVDAGDINLGYFDKVTLGVGKDTLYLGAIGAEDDPSPAETDWTSYGISTATGAASDIVYAALKTANPVGALVLSQAFEIGGTLLSNWLGGMANGAQNTDSGVGNDNASAVELMDWDPRYDTVVLPTTTNDLVSMDSSNASTGVFTFSLDAENGGNFLQAHLVGDYASEFKSAFDLSDSYVGGSFNKSIAATYFESRMIIEKDDSGDVAVYINGSLLDPDSYADIYSDLDASLENSQTIQHLGAFFGMDASLYDTREFAAGTYQSDVFTILANADNEVHYVMGFEGDDLVRVDQQGAYLDFDGGEGTDIISFLGMEYGNTGLSEDGVVIDLSDSTGNVWQGAGQQNPSYVNKLINVEGVVGTVNADTLTGNDADNYLKGEGGADTLTGGAGSDTFAFADDGSTDTVVDFSAGDKLLLNGVTSADDWSVAQNSAIDGVEIGFSSSSILLEGVGSLGQGDFGTSLTDDGLEIVLGGDTGEDDTPPGDTVICTYMHARGLIASDVYQWDRFYGREVLGETVLRGYHWWAIPLVETVLRQSEPATRLVVPAARAWAQEMAHRCDPANHPKGAWLGRAILAVGVPLCFGLGLVVGRRACAGERPAGQAG